MRICIPTETDLGFDARVHEHFGSAPIFTIFETDSGILEFVNNPNHQHIHGTCKPLNALHETHVDLVVSIGMGLRAVQELKEGGIKTFRAKGTTVQEVIRNYEAGALEEITLYNSCTEHHCH